MRERVLEFIRRPNPERFAELALDLFAFQFERTPPYRRFAEMEGRTPATVRRWQDIPAVPASAFKLARLACAPSRWVFLSSGTTGGAAGRSHHHLPDLEVYRASALSHFAAFLLPDRPRLDFLSLIPPPNVQPDSSLSRMAGWIVEELGANGQWFAGSDELRLAALIEALRRTVRSGRRVCLLGTTGVFRRLFSVMASQALSFALPPGSRLMDTGGDKEGADPLPREGFRRLCASLLGLPPTHCVNEYGMTELSSQLYDGALADTVSGRQPRWILQPPAWLRVRVIDPATLDDLPPGETGIIQFLDLANWASVAAIRTEDVGRLTSGGVELRGRLPGADRRGCSLAAAELRLR